MLRLNRASLLGSRDYTLKPGFIAPRTKDDAALGIKARRETWIDERLFLCRAVVLGEEVEPERIKEKTKQRQRRVKRVKSQHSYTVLRISEFTVFGPEVLETRPEDTHVPSAERDGLDGKVEGESGGSVIGDISENKVDNLKGDVHGRKVNNAEELAARIKAISGKKVAAGGRKEAQEYSRKLESIMEEYGV